MIKSFTIILSSVLFLAGCSDKPMSLKEYQVRKIEINPDWYDCHTKDVIKPNNPVTNAKLGKYVIQLRTQLTECQMDSKTVETYIKEYNSNVDIYNGEKK